MGLLDLDKLILTNAQRRNLSMIKPFIETGNWVTSISLANIMYKDPNYHKKEISKLSAILSNLWRTTDILERKVKRNLYFNHIHKNHISTFAYRLNPNLIKQSDLWLHQK